MRPLLFQDIARKISFRMKIFSSKTYKILLSIIVLLVLLTLSAPFALRTYLATPDAAVHLSQLLSDAVGQPVAITHVELSGGALHLKGVTLANPDGFPLSKLLTLDSITLKPVWSSLLSDRRVFEKIALEGITVDLRRNSAGVWNFDKLQRLFSASKPSPAELFIQRLQIAKGTVQVNDWQFAGLAFDIADLATKGSQKSGFQLEFNDPGRNRYLISGKARMGKEPELDVALSSSSISLKSLPELLKIKNGYLPQGGNATVQVSAALQKGMLKGTAEVAFTAAAMPVVTSGETFSGNLSLAAEYDLQKDLLSIENIALHLNRLLALRASGQVREVKRSKIFVIDIRSDEIDIGSLARLIPELEQKKLAIGGMLDKSSLRLSGSKGEGITTAVGKSGFSHGSLRQDGKLVFNDLNVAVTISGKGNVLTATGKAAQAQSQEAALLEMLDAPFKVVFDRHLKTVTAESESISAKAQGITFAGRVSYVDGQGLIERARIKTKDMTMALGRLSAKIPEKELSLRTVRYPLEVDFSGCEIQRADAVLKNLKGSIRGAYAADPEGKWLEGTAELAADKAGGQGKTVDAPRLHAEFTKTGGKVDVKTAWRGASVEGSAAFDPFAPLENVVFKLTATGIQLAGIMEYAGLRGDTAVSAGTVDAACNGSYSRTKGILCHFEANGKDIAVTGKGRKTLISAGGIRIKSDLSDTKLIIHQVLMTVGKDIGLTAAGTLENPFSEHRQGKIMFTVPNTSLTAMTDSFLNVLPRSLQEATVGGNLGAEGNINLQGRNILVEGAVTLGHISIDAPTQKVKVSDVNGVFPLSLDLAGKAAVKLPSTSAFKRENYEALLEKLRKPVGKEQTITMGPSAFGGLGVDSVKLQVRASNGITEIVSLHAALFDGVLLGKGFITSHNGILYRGDMLLNSLSLVQLCKAFPAITGYISGRIDGIFSLQGKGGGLSALSGFTEIWARDTAEEKMLVSREFLQKLSGKNLSGFFFSSDRAYDHAGIKAALENGFLTFDALDISHTNFLGIRDLGVSIVPSQNRIAIEHLLNSIKEATVRGKSATGATDETGSNALREAPPAPEFKWNE